MQSMRSEFRAGFLSRDTSTTKPPDLSRPAELSGSTVPDPVEVLGTTTQLIPSVEELGAIADALRGFLEIYEEWRADPYVSISYCRNTHSRAVH